MTTTQHSDQRAVLDAAHHDAASVLALTRDLVAIPSRGGVDPYHPVVDRVRDWLDQRHLPSTVLTDTTGAIVGLTCEITGHRPGPRYVLDACLDTAPFGDETHWQYPPASATVHDGWLHGRGSADSKAGAAIFCHIAARLAATAATMHGSTVLLFDLDEHTGGFAGAKTYFEGANAPTNVAGVIIGYPGLHHLVVGGRGVHRLKLHVHGVASHSGGRSSTPNAIAKAADLIHALTNLDLHHTQDDRYPMGAKITVTAIEGGHGYSVTPDLCTLNLDTRTTLTFDATAADRLIREAITAVDTAWPDTRPTLVQRDTTWPAYALAADSPLRAAIIAAADGYDLDVAAKIAGPSNIGNYLAGIGIPATAGFGVDYSGLHATNERVRIDTIPIVQATYHTAVLTLTSPAAQPSR